MGLRAGLDRCGKTRHTLYRRLGGPQGRSGQVRKDPAHIVQEAGWASGQVWTGAENLAHTGIRSPDRPPRSESLYRLSYPGPI